MFKALFYINLACMLTLVVETLGIFLFYYEMNKSDKDLFCVISFRKKVQIVVGFNASNFTIEFHESTMSIQLRYVYKQELYEKIGFYKMLTVITNVPYCVICLFLKTI